MRLSRGSGRGGNRNAEAEVGVELRDGGGGRQRYCEPTDRDLACLAHLHCLGENVSTLLPSVICMNHII